MSEAPKRGLGKGLGALIPTSATMDGPSSASAQPAEIASVHGLRYAELPIDAIVPNPRQPRTVFDEDALTELVNSIASIGLLQPVVVRSAGTGYELVAGERRWRASGLAGLKVIPAIIRQTDDDALLRDALLENLHRANLNPLEEAAAYQQLLEDFGCTQEELATRIGRSRPQVTNTLRLLKLPPEVQLRVAAGVISAGHARALLSLQDPEAMKTLATRIVAEGLSVRSVEEIILLGDTSTASRRKRARSTSTPTGELRSDIGIRLSDRLDTRVTVTGLASNKSRGRIVIEVADADDLRRIADAIDPG
ncbi:MAG: ParB/RepB/Spo0J family partition protein [Actinomycetota bacterium]|nr:ParB/RepB/Spo0J family partition protein [Actinomycetota bacterium]MDP2287356.1 ParB/RepB/Spo0J family partition protein [Actinomycetota bacterium]